MLSNSLHEFGHLLGLEHEQMHNESKCELFPDSPYEDSVMVGPYDKESVMNYCNLAALSETKELIYNPIFEEKPLGFSR